MKKTYTVAADGWIMMRYFKAGAKVELDHRQAKYLLLSKQIKAEVAAAPKSDKKK